MDGIEVEGSRDDGGEIESSRAGRRPGMAAWKAVVLVLTVPLLVIAILVVVAQRRILFPLTTSERSALARGWTASETGGGIHAWTSQWTPGRRTAIMLHGNAVTLGAMAFVADAWVREGWNVVLVEFPGYDGNAGSPSADSIHASADAAWRWAMSHGSARRRTVVVSNSIGTGAAAALTGARDPAGLLVVSGVDDLASVVRSQVPFVPPFLVFDRMRSADAIRSYGGWTRVWHAEDDVVVPASQGRAIALAAGTAVTWRSGGHQLFWDPDLQAELRAEADRIVPDGRD
jgi:hypothetical protein